MSPSAICTQTIQLLSYAQSLPPDTEISVDTLSNTLGQPKRRIYDVLSVLEALGTILRKNRTFTLTPNGIPGITSVSELTHKILNKLQQKQMTAKQIFKSLNCNSNEVRRGYDILQVLVGAGRLAVEEDGVFWHLQDDIENEYIEALVKLALGTLYVDLLSETDRNRIMNFFNYENDNQIQMFAIRQMMDFSIQSNAYEIKDIAMILQEVDSRIGYIRGTLGEYSKLEKAEYEEIESFMNSVYE